MPAVSGRGARTGRPVCVSPNGSTPPTRTDRKHTNPADGSFAPETGSLLRPRERRPRATTGSHTGLSNCQWNGGANVTLPFFFFVQTEMAGSAAAAILQPE